MCFVVAMDHQGDSAQDQAPVNRSLLFAVEPNVEPEKTVPKEPVGEVVETSVGAASSGAT